jgi:DNA-binding NarL/FixJ family response regulator
MPKGRRLASLSLAAADHAQLAAWSKRPKTTQALAMPSRVILLAAEGLSNTVIARQIFVNLHTVGKWRAIWNRVCMGCWMSLVQGPRASFAIAM